MKNYVLFEIGVEELPARFIDDAEKQLKDKTIKWLNDLRIGFSSIQSFSTPRRLAVLINEVANEQMELVEEVRGPRLDIAKNKDDSWSKAAIGFTKGQQTTTQAIYVKKIKDIEYIFVQKQFEKKRSIELLHTFKDVITSIHFPQTMRWGVEEVRFARPIRWLVAMFNDEVIPFEMANVRTNNLTYGHRFLSGPIEIDEARHYEKLLLENYVVVDPLKRKNMIISQFSKLEHQEGFKILTDKKLLNEVRNLVEYPTSFYGEFASHYLHLPEEVLITSMKEHQRYFPVASQDNKLLPYFVSVRNGTDYELNNVIRGNEKVLVARLADGQFFYEDDKNKSIDFFIEKLKTVVFQENIGTYDQKMARVQQLSEYICDTLALNDDIKANTLRVAQICKFDLVSSMVNEFPELQGIMGEMYAAHFGEKKIVAKSVREHYMPLHTKGVLPTEIPGAIVSIADKMDTIVGCFSVGLVPSGSQDPYGLRRQAVGLLRIILNEKWDISVDELISHTLKIFKITDDALENKLKEFVNNRAQFILKEKGIDHDIISAVIHESVGNMFYTAAKAKILLEKKQNNQFKSIQEAFIRAINLGTKHSGTINIDPSLFETPSEKALFEQLNKTAKQIEKYEQVKDAEKVLQQLILLANPIHQFFDNNLVMTNDVRIKNNRLSMLHRLSETILKFADFTKVEWNQDN